MCSNCPAEDAVKRIDAILEGGKAKWAHDFLTGTKRWIETNRHVTVKQLVALAKVEDKAGGKNVREGKPANERKRSGLFS